MRRGIVTVAFGAQYDECAAHCFRLSRKRTNLPFHIVTNIPRAQRSSVWAKVSRVSFEEIRVHQNRNRAVKTMLCRHTPFDVSLFVDCDSVVRQDGIGKLFSQFEDSGCNVGLRVCVVWPEKGRILRIYKRAMKLFDCTYPFIAWEGCINIFRQSPATELWFRRWHDCWKKMGAGRDMAALAAATQKQQEAGLDVWEIPERYFQWEKGIVWHLWNNQWHDRVGVPRMKKFKPFDKHVQQDFQKVDA